MKTDLFTDAQGFTPKEATLSDCGLYRYTLWRRWGTGPHVCFIGLNPSTADAHKDDATLRRCMGFARDWGYAGLCMVNLFAFRATEPDDMKAAADPIGPENDAHLVREMRAAAMVVAAWGSHGTHKGRFRAVMELCPDIPLYCIDMTLHRQPKHPLYIPADFKPHIWRP